MALNTRLDDRRFTLPELVKLTGAPDKSVRNWLARGKLEIGERRYGRQLFSLLEVLQVAAAFDLTARAHIDPSDAAGLARLLAQEVEQRSPRDAAGYPIGDPNAVPRRLAIGSAVVNGETHVGLIDLTQPDYLDPRSPWGRAHVVLPIAALVADVLFRLLELESSR